MKLTEVDVIKLKLFEIIANNSDKLCDDGKCTTAIEVADNVRKVYRKLFLS